MSSSNCVLFDAILSSMDAITDLVIAAVSTSSGDGADVAAILNSRQALCL